MRTEFDFFDTVDQEISARSAQIELLSVDYLLTQKPPEMLWTVDNLLLSGGLSLLCGKPKVGKSTLVRQLAISVARGNQFLGRETKQGNVVLFCLEDHLWMLQKAMISAGVSRNDPIFFHCGPKPKNSIRALEQILTNYQPTLVVIDTLFRFISCHDTNDYTSVLDSLTPLSELVRRHSTHILLIHHAGKAERLDSLDSVLGSVGIHGSMDTTLLLRRSSAVRVIESQQRYGKALETSILNFEEETGRTFLGPTQSSQELAIKAKAISQFLKSHNLPVPEPAIIENVSGRTSVLRRALRICVDQGTVVRSGNGSKSCPFLYQTIQNRDSPNKDQGNKKNDLLIGAQTHKNQ